MHRLLTELNSESSLSEQNEVDAAKDEPDSEYILLVNSTSANALSPGEMRKLMSAPGKSKATTNKKQTAFSSGIVINGKTYRECNQRVTYYVTKSSLSSQYSLVDRGSNGGVAGSDMRFIETHPDRKVDIRGVDNHQISAILLATAGGLTTTITG